MIHININDEKPPEKWCREAKSVTEQLKSSNTPEERKKLIKSNEKLWGKLKCWLLELSHGKCWYSEAKEIFSHYHVDHFRPKERYWWLAFDWRNYRISGGVGNIRKGIYFPLREGSFVATGPGCDLRDEIIYLLDLTDPNDVFLLTFDESGFSKPAAFEGTWEHERVEVTIKLLHLDFPPLVDERKRIWTKCLRLISRAENLMRKKPSATRNADLKNILRELREMISVEAELSSTARACLLSSGISWLIHFVSSP